MLRDARCPACIGATAVNRTAQRDALWNQRKGDRTREFLCFRDVRRNDDVLEPCRNRVCGAILRGE